MTDKGAFGRTFDDFAIGQTLEHAVARTLNEGDNAVYLSLTGDRNPLFCDSSFARRLGFRRELIHDMLLFNVVFGRSVPDVSAIALANLGYADVRFIKPVYPGDTISAISKVMGKKENRDGKSGIVYVRTQGFNQYGDSALSFYRWVMLPRREGAKNSGERALPNLPAEATIEAAATPRDDATAGVVGAATGGRWMLEDYRDGERVHHGGAMTIEEAEHASATRLYQNNSRVHFDARRMADRGGRLVYGGHVISVARALAFDGLENAVKMLAWNGATHANPVHAGDTLYVFSDVLGRRDLPGRTRWGALRLKTVAVKNVDPREETVAVKVQREKGEPAAYGERVVLEMDYFVAAPKRG